MKLVDNPTLLIRKSLPVWNLDEAIPLVQMMEDEIKERGFTSLAAPLLGFLKQVVVKKLLPNGYVVYLNPSLEIPGISPRVYTKEKCPVWDKSYTYFRYMKVKVKYRDESWEEREQEMEGDDAIILQHEVDHLKGVHPFTSSAYEDTKDGALVPVVRTIKNPRNEPCPCGSGLKYKRCCGLPKEEEVMPNCPKCGKPLQAEKLFTEVPHSKSKPTGKLTCSCGHSESKGAAEKKLLED